MTVSFHHLNRRLHLYLGLVLLPWFAMYAVSSIPFAHTQYFERRDAAKGLPLWTLRAELPLETPIPDDPTAMRAFGADLLRRTGVETASFGTYRAGPAQLNVYAYSFWKSTQLKYFSDRKLVTVEDRRFRWDHFLTGMHARGGFEQEGWMATSWSVVVDVVCVSMLVWIASGLYMWWGLPGHRRWGWLAIGAGTAAFVLFTVAL